MGLFDIFTKKTNDITLNMNFNVPNEVYKVKTFEYDKIEALEIFLMNEGLSSETIDSIVKSKLPFDRAWKMFNTTTGTNLHEYIVLMKLLVIEGKLTGERPSALLTQIVYYLFNYIAMHFDLELPTLKKLVASENKKAFIDGLNNSIPDKVFRMIDYSIFDSLAFYSTASQKSLSTIYQEMLKIIEMNNIMFERYYIAEANKEVWHGIIGKIIELAYFNYKPSLNKINVNRREKSEIIIGKDFYDFSDLKATNSGYTNNEYFLEGKNMEKAIEDIEKVLNIYNECVNKNMIKNIGKANINNLVVGMMDGEKLTTTLSLNYTPLTPTGRKAKNMCSVIFSINLTDSPYLVDGIMHDGGIDGIKYNNIMNGRINYVNDGSISGFSLNSTEFQIDGKSLLIDDLNELKISKFY